MATINQIRKSIEVAERRLAKANKNVEMYDVRVQKAIEKARKATGKEFDRANYSFVLSGRDEWELKYSIDSNLEYYYEYCKKIQNEKANIERLTKVLEEITVETVSSSLVETLSGAMEGFKAAWTNKMMNWFGKYYDYIADHLDAARVRYEKARRIYAYMCFCGRFLRKPRIFAFVENAKNEAAQIISDKAARMSKSDYLEMKYRETLEDWNLCVEKLAKKCEKFGLNESAIKVSEPEVTEKGFECYLTDGTNRVINARMIWAAEYSDIVSPHTRYIVTERRR